MVSRQYNLRRNKFFNIYFISRNIWWFFCFSLCSNWPFFGVIDMIWAHPVSSPFNVLLPFIMVTNWQQIGDRVTNVWSRCDRGPSFGKPNPCKNIIACTATLRGVHLRLQRTRLQKCANLLSDYRSKASGNCSLLWLRYQYIRWSKSNGLVYLLASANNSDGSKNVGSMAWKTYHSGKIRDILRNRFILVVL